MSKSRVRIVPEDRISVSVPKKTSSVRASTSETINKIKETPLYNKVKQAPFSVQIPTEKAISILKHVPKKGALVSVLAGSLAVYLTALSINSFSVSDPSTRHVPTTQETQAASSISDNASDTATKELATAEPKHQEEKQPEKSSIELEREKFGTEFRLRKRETLSVLLKRAGVNSKQAYLASQALRKVTDLRRLKPGQFIGVTLSNDKTLEKVVLRDEFDSVAIAQLTGDNKFSGQRDTITIIPQTKLVEGGINESLYLSAQKEGTPQIVIAELVRMMSFSVDFQRDIRKGDRFRVYFERRYAPAFGDIEEGRILQAELDLKRGLFDATLLTDNTIDGAGNYYDRSGASLKKSLMLTPVDGARLSGVFGRRKKHPVLGYSKMHNGLDFAAPRGTPIMAGGDGVIERANRYGSFGNYVRIKHGGNYKTVYAHLHRFAKGMRKGKKVKQGDIIGYVGSTGRSTGPHLHYEIHRGGKPINPHKLKLPTAKHLKGDALKRFQNLRSQRIAEIDNLRAVNTRQNNSDTGR